MRLYVIDGGTLRIDKGVVFTPAIDGGVHIEIPVPVYLIETDDDEIVLTDTGLHPANLDDPYHAWGEEGAGRGRAAEPAPGGPAGAASRRDGSLGARATTSSCRTVINGLRLREPAADATSRRRDKPHLS